MKRITRLKTKREILKQEITSLTDQYRDQKKKPKTSLGIKIMSASVIGMQVLFMIIKIEDIDAEILQIQDSKKLNK